VVAPPRYRKWPVARDLVLTLAILLLTSGCLMTNSSDPQRRGPLVAQDVVRLDLRELPTREEAGFAEGRNSLILERVGDAIDVELTLPTGVLKTEAFGVVLAGPVGETAADHAAEVVLNRRPPDIDALRSELMEEAEVLGLDAAEIQAVSTRSAVPRAIPTTASSPAPTRSRRRPPWRCATAMPAGAGFSTTPSSSPARADRRLLRRGVDLCRQVTAGSRAGAWRSPQLRTPRLWPPLRGQRHGRTLRGSVLCATACTGAGARRVSWVREEPVYRRVGDVDSACELSRACRRPGSRVMRGSREVAGGVAAGGLGLADRVARNDSMKLMSHL
jgi:hypothetical protein